MKNLGTVAGFAALAFAVGVVAGSLLNSERTTHEQSELGVGAPSASLTDMQSRPAPDVEPPQERVVVSSTPQQPTEAPREATQATAEAARAQSPSGKLFRDVSDYEASSEFNPANRVLSSDERLRLAEDLRQLEARAEIAKMRVMADAVGAIELMRERGLSRVVDSRGTVPTPGALVTDVRTTRDGTSTVELYEQDFPQAGQYRAELDAIRDQGLAVVRDYFRPQ